MDSLKESLSDKYKWKNSDNNDLKKKIILVLFKDKIEIYICKILFICDNYTAGIRCHKTALEFMLNLQTGKILSSTFKLNYIVISPTIDKIDKNLTIGQVYHRKCEILIKKLLEDIYKNNSELEILPFTFNYI